MRINFIIAICGFIFLSGCALNQDVKSLERRMLQMEIKMKQMKDDAASQQSHDKNLKTQYAGQSAEFDQMREEIAKLNGRLDEIEHNFNQALKKNSDAITQFSQTASGSSPLIRPENPMGHETMPQNQVGLQPDVSGGNPVAHSAPVNSSEKEIYDVAKRAYDQGDYEAARQGFESFLKRYPQSGEADNARFWIGESYFKEGWYQKAILEYQEVIEKYPNDNKAPSAYLKQGLAFDKLGEKANARLVFQALISKFPNSSEAKTARQKISQLE